MQLLKLTCNMTTIFSIVGITASCFYQTMNLIFLLVYFLTLIITLLSYL